MDARLPHEDKVKSRICGARTRSGGQCQRSPMANGRCHLHGGKSLSGWAHPNARTGRYMAVIPARMGERFRMSVSDPELLVLREEIALADARIDDLLKRVESGESGKLWGRLKNLIEDLESKPDTSAQRILLSVKAVIDGALADYDAWEEVDRWLERRRRLTESERKRLVETQQIITVEQALALLGAVSEVVRNHVSDRAALAAISHELRGLMVRESSG